jgi:hypothetical protein
MTGAENNCQILLPGSGFHKNLGGMQGTLRSKKLLGKILR